MNIGIIGCGLIGQKRAAVADGHRITWCMDSDPARAEYLAGLKGTARYTASWQDVVTADEVDAVIVSTSHDSLVPITFAAVQGGKHVLVEKPAARSATELEPVIAAARKAGVVVKVGFNHRFHPSFRKAREIVDSGVLGPLMFVRGRYGHGGRVGYDQEWRCMAELSGGGQLIDQGAHLIDLSRWFLGDFAEVHGYVQTYFWDIAVDDNCFLALRSAAGQMAWLHASWTEWKNLFCFEICGRNGKLQVDGLGGSYGVERLTFYRMLPEMGPPETTIWEYPFPDDSWKLELDEFFTAISEGREPGGNLDDARAVLEIIDQVYGRRQP